MELRKEATDDRTEIFALHKAAFDRDGEAMLVDALRNNRNLELSLVATSEENAVIGHIAFSAMRFEAESDCRAAGLGPVAVAEAHRRQGVGAALVREGLEEMKRKGFDAVFVLGSEKYYPRFGFRRAADLGLSSVYPETEDNFFVLELQPGGLKGATGFVKYSPEFDKL